MLRELAQNIARHQTVAPIDWQSDTSVDDLQEGNSTQGSPPRASSDLTVVLTDAICDSTIRANRRQAWPTSSSTNTGI